MTENTEAVAEVIETEASVEVTKSEVALEADAKADVVVAETETEKAANLPTSGKDDAAEDSTEKAAKPKTDEEESAAMAAAETPADEEAEAKKKPMAPKSDEVIEGSVSEINDGLEKAFSDLVLTVKSLQAEVEMLKSSKVDVETAKQSFEAVAKDIATAANTFNEFGKRVELVEQDTAFRKSGDLGEIVQNQPETVEKSLWGGSFLKTADLFI